MVVLQGHLSDPKFLTLSTTPRPQWSGEDSTHKSFRLRTTIGMRLPGGAPGCGDLPRPASLLQNRQIRRTSSQFVHQHPNIG